MDLLPYTHDIIHSFTATYLFHESRPNFNHGQIHVTVKMKSSRPKSHSGRYMLCPNVLRFCPKLCPKSLLCLNELSPNCSCPDCGPTVLQEVTFLPNCASTMPQLSLFCAPTMPQVTFSPNCA